MCSRGQLWAGSAPLHPLLTLPCLCSLSRAAAWKRELVWKRSPCSLLTASSKLQGAPFITAEVQPCLLLAARSLPWRNKWFKESSLITNNTTSFLFFSLLFLFLFFYFLGFLDLWHILPLSTAPEAQSCHAPTVLVGSGLKAAPK